jgi:tripartite-type tricarboxylate transporter receptor subunit TctC
MTRTTGIGRRGLLAGASALGAGLLAPASLRAQEAFPSRTIEVVTHAGVGGGTDITARMMMVGAPGEFRQELTVVNRTAGSGAQALQYLASKPADGHTIILMTQTHLLTMLRNRNLPQLTDLIPLARATDDPQMVLVRRDSPLRTPQDLLTAGRARSLRFGGTHVGGVDHVAVFAFGRAAQLQQPTLVPFRGGGEIVINLVGGNIDVGLLNPAEAEAQLRAGEVRPLMVLSEARMAGFPNTPTAKELGINAVARLEQGLVRAMSTPLYRGYLENTGQSLESVVGREAWGRQLAGFHEEGREALTALGLLR